MKTFNYVEDYIEVVTGYIDVVTGKRVSQFYFGINPIINLARYDVGVLESMCETVLQSNALTEKQGDLACKIILKYQRQLANKLIDVGPLESPKWRIPLRKMDYTRSLSLSDNKLTLRFPFNNELIESIRTFGRESQGSVKWNRDSKVWEVALTEYNVSWIVTWAEVNQVKVEPEVIDLMNLISQVEQTPYAIELTVNNGLLDITNCPDSLRNYVTDELGGWDMSNLLNLVNASPTLGFTINADLAQAIISEYGFRFYNIATNREVKINPDTLMSTNDFSSVLDYAVTCDVWPVVVYEPDLSNRMLNRLLERFDESQVLVSGNQKNPTITAETKFIHTYKPIRNLDSIPMIISSAGMVFGGDKQIMIQRAKKVVYCAADVYNKKQIGKKVKDIAG